MITRLNSEIKSFVGILHIGDCHIRLNKRHDEYENIFLKLYADIEKMPLNIVICVLGDVLHSKSDLSPECVKLASEFLNNLANLRPVILIAGNHDATLANKNRLDSLSPIVNAIAHKNLFYLKDTGLYMLGDILFNNMSVFDIPENYILAKNIPKSYKNESNYLVSLFHGAVNDAITDVGYTVVNKTITNSLFDGHDIALLGDIHKTQVLQDYNEFQSKPAVVYCGSLIQQNHGEDIKGHGYILWNLKTKKYCHVELENEYGFFTVEINKGQLVSDIKNIPKKSILRVKCFESIPSEVKSALATLSPVTKILETSYVKIENDVGSNVLKSSNTSFTINDVSDIKCQNVFIKDYLISKNPTLEPNVLAEVLSINETINNLLKKEHTVKTIHWKPIRFEFSNMFSYGEDNIIDFTKAKDVIGLFAKNTAGKSSIFDALCFCIFDKSSKAFKASHVINNQKNEFFM